MMQRAAARRKRGAAAALAAHARSWHAACGDPLTQLRFIPHPACPTAPAKECPMKLSRCRAAFASMIHRVSKIVVPLIAMVAVLLPALPGNARAISMDPQMEE